MWLSSLRLRWLQLVAALIVAGGAATGLGVYVTHRDGGLHLNCGRTNGQGIDEWITTTCAPVPLSLEPGSYRFVADFSNCTGYRASLSPDGGTAQEISQQT
ncbi:MAG: hypothetical protein ACREQ5_20360, partial [Candidatus Dormibacteria bacterium]